MKLTLRLLSLFLSLVLLLSFCACELSFLRPSREDDTPFIPTEIPAVTVTAFGESYGEQLNVNEKALYDAFIAAELGQNEFTVSFPIPLEICRGRTPNASEQDEVKETLSLWVANAVFAVWLDAPSLFWLDLGDFRFSTEFKQNAKKVVAVTDVNVTLTARITAEEAVQRQAALAEKLKTIAPTGATEADKIYAIDFYLTELITYDLEAADRATVTGALLDGACVCEGYAHAFQLLCQRLGIVCVCILGHATADGETEAHMWNAVKLDGSWYYCDPTWNDTSSSTRYLLVGNETLGHESVFAESHEPLATFGQSKAFLLPVVSDTAYRP